jgi:transcriptional regulator with XRE-family HTH domain
MLDMTLGEKLRELRVGKGWSLRAVAEKLSEMPPRGPVTRGAVFNWEADLNPPSTDHLFKLADLYQVDVNQLRRHQREAQANG